MNKQSNNAQLVPAPILNYSGSVRKIAKKCITVVKKHQVKVRPESLSGDAPKDFIYVYEYGKLNCKKANPKSWVPYIAKVGHKWYPTESITEHLITRLGQEWGFNLANSKLYIFSGQLRYCSEFFTKLDQELVHGADILARYLDEADSDFIEQIDKRGWSQELLTFNFVKEAIENIFPNYAEEIVGELINMLIFDALVGNNDRHFFNWGVIRHLKENRRPYFSPIYDTARGLFWNYSDKRLLELTKNSDQKAERIASYNNKTKPKIG